MRRRGLLPLLLLALAWHVFDGWQSGKYFKSKNKTAPSVQTVVISPKARTHILYGDARGGGHKFGVGKPCKSEFPKDWDEEDIIGNIQSLAANDNLNWREQDNGYFVAESFVDGVKMRVVLDRERDGVVTAYPTNTGRNACDINRKPANDN